MTAGSTFEMSSAEKLNEAQVALAHQAHILSRRTRKQPTTGQRVLLAVHHNDEQRLLVHRIVAEVDPDSVER